MARYTPNDIARFWLIARKLGLEASNEFYDTPVEELVTICNGVGGEGSWLSGVLTLIYHYYQTSAAIHDVDYHFAPVSRQKADRRFLDNMVRHWHTAYGNRSTSRIIAHA